MIQLPLHHLTWLAALIDGEGCVQIVRNRCQGKRRRFSHAYYFNITVTMCDREMVDRAHQITGLGSILGPYKRENPNYRDAYRWSVCSQEAASLARAIHPYLLIKQKQAELGILLMEVSARVAPAQSIKGLSGKQRKSPELLAEQERIYTRWQAIQKRLPDPTLELLAA